jgi:DNA end-binding protein Ku
MAKAVWTGTLSFGLVNLSVALYPATEPKDVRFHLFDRETGQRVRYRRVIAGESAPEPQAEDELPGTREEPTNRAGSESVVGPRSTVAQQETEVAYDDLVRGVEVEPGRAALLEPGEIERVRPQRSRTIDIEDFVDLADIDPVYFEKTYFVAARPDAGGDKPYVLLHRALQRSGKVGIGRFVLRTKPHLVAVRPVRGVLALETLFFGDEVREPSRFAPALDPATITEGELDLAQRLIDVLATEWDPGRYSDDYREQLLRMIAEKTPSPVEEERAGGPSPSPAADLMDALRKSVAAAKKSERDTA